MRVFVWHRVDKCSDNYHSDGGVVVFAATKLLGFMARNGIGDPIGDATSVYAWSLDSLRQRLADTSGAVKP